MHGNIADSMERLVKLAEQSPDVAVAFRSGRVANASLLTPANRQSPANLFMAAAAYGDDLNASEGNINRRLDCSGVAGVSINLQFPLTIFQVVATSVEASPSTAKPPHAVALLEAFKDAVASAASSDDDANDVASDDDNVAEVIAKAMLESMVDPLQDEPHEPFPGCCQDHATTFELPLIEQAEVSGDLPLAQQDGTDVHVEALQAIQSQSLCQQDRSMLSLTLPRLRQLLGSRWLTHKAVALSP